MIIFQADMIFDFMKIINFGICTTICSWFRYHLEERTLKKWNIFLPCLGWFSLKSLQVLWLTYLGCWIIAFLHINRAAPQGQPPLKGFKKKKKKMEKKNQKTWSIFILRSYQKCSERASTWFQQKQALPPGPWPGGAAPWTPELLSPPLTIYPGATPWY